MLLLPGQVLPILPLLLLGCQAAYSGLSGLVAFLCGGLSSRNGILTACLCSVYVAFDCSASILLNTPLLGTDELFLSFSPSWTG